MYCKSDRLDPSRPQGYARGGTSSYHFTGLYLRGGGLTYSFIYDFRAPDSVVLHAGTRKQQTGVKVNGDWAPGAYGADSGSINVMDGSDYNLCLPRSPSDEAPGHADAFRGWYDVQGCGFCYDYCRWVGSCGSGGDPTAQLTTTCAHVDGRAHLMPGPKVFDGTAEKVIHKTSHTIESIEKFTVCIWEKFLQDFTGHQGPFWISDATGKMLFIENRNTFNYLGIGTENKKFNRVAANAQSQLKDGAFHHVCITRDTNTVRAYIDGVAIALVWRDVYGSWDIRNSQYVIGAYAHAGFVYPSTGKWVGAVNEVAVWDRVLNAAAVATVLDSNLPMTGYWSCRLAGTRNVDSGSTPPWGSSNPWVWSKCTAEGARSPKAKVMLGTYAGTVSNAIWTVSPIDFAERVVPTADANTRFSGLISGGGNYQAHISYIQLASVAAGTVADAGYWRDRVASYCAARASWSGRRACVNGDLTVTPRDTFKLTMGAVVDWFKPVAPMLLSAFLTSHAGHAWSATERGAYVVPQVHTNGVCVSTLKRNTLGWVKKAGPETGGRFAEWSQVLQACDPVEYDYFSVECPRPHDIGQVYCIGRAGGKDTLPPVEEQLPFSECTGDVRAEWLTLDPSKAQGYGPNDIAYDGCGPGTGCATAHYASAAFDDDTGTFWDGCCPGFPEQAIEYTFEGAPVVTAYAITTQDSECPVDWTFQGSSDGGASWTTLDTRTGQQCNNGTPKEYVFGNEGRHSRYRWKFTKGVGGNLVTILNGYRIVEIAIKGTGSRSHEAGTLSGNDPYARDGWTKFWWYRGSQQGASAVFSETGADVLKDAFSAADCAPDDPHCFQRLPSALREDCTELLAVDGDGTALKWAFDSGNAVAHAAWQAFHDHKRTSGSGLANQAEAWNPVALAGAATSTQCDSFQYRVQDGVASLLLDDDTCVCYSCFDIGAAMCGAYSGSSYGTGGPGVDKLKDDGCSVPVAGNDLALYFRDTCLDAPCHGANHIDYRGTRNYLGGVNRGVLYSTHTGEMLAAGEDASPHRRHSPNLFASQAARHGTGTGWSSQGAGEGTHTTSVLRGHPEDLVTVSDSNRVDSYMKIVATGAWVSETNRVILYPSGAGGDTSCGTTERTDYVVSFYAKTDTENGASLKFGFYGNLGGVVGVGPGHSVSVTTKWQRFHGTCGSKCKIYRYGCMCAVEFGSGESSETTFYVAAIQAEPVGPGSAPSDFSAWHYDPFREHYGGSAHAGVAADDDLGTVLMLHGDGATRHLLDSVVVGRALTAVGDATTAPRIQWVTSRAKQNCDEACGEKVPQSTCDVPAMVKINTKDALLAVVAETGHTCTGWDTDTATITPFYWPTGGCEWRRETDDVRCEASHSTYGRFCACKTGGTLAFDGDSDYFKIASSSNWGSWDFNDPKRDFTIDAWFYATANDDGRELFITDFDGSYGIMAGWYQGVLKIWFGDSDATTSDPQEKWCNPGGLSVGAPPLNQWHHFAFVRNGAGFYRAYLDGVMKNWVAVSDCTISSGILALGTGSVNFAAVTWKGYIDEFRISKFARWTASSFVPPTTAYAAPASAARWPHDGREHVSFWGSGAANLFASANQGSQGKGEGNHATTKIDGATLTESEFPGGVSVYNKFTSYWRVVATGTWQAESNRVIIHSADSQRATCCYKKGTEYLLSFFAATENSEGTEIGFAFYGNSVNHHVMLTPSWQRFYALSTTNAQGYLGVEPVNFLQNTISD